MPCYAMLCYGFSKNEVNVFCTVLYSCVLEYWHLRMLRKALKQEEHHHRFAWRNHWVDVCMGGRTLFNHLVQDETRAHPTDDCVPPPPPTSMYSRRESFLYSSSRSPPINLEWLLTLALSVWCHDGLDARAVAVKVQASARMESTCFEQYSCVSLEYLHCVCCGNHSKKKDTRFKW